MTLIFFHASFSSVWTSWIIVCLVYYFTILVVSRVAWHDITITSLFIFIYLLQFFTSYSSLLWTHFVTGTIRFHVALSNGVSTVGPRYKAASVKSNNADCSTWLTARREGQQENLDGQSILLDINNLVRNYLHIFWAKLQFMLSRNFLKIVKN